VASIERDDDRGRPATPASAWPGASPASAAEPRASGPVVLDLPCLEVPFNTREGAFPSMSQSLALSRSLYLGAHEAIDRRVGRRRAAVSTLAKVGFDLASLWLPGGHGWLHEEWHRAVLSRRGIASRNSAYDFSGSLIVRAVADEDLMTLKRDHPADLVRAHAAGGEAHQALALALQKEAFFGRAPRRNLTTIWMARLSTSLYLALSPTRRISDATRAIAEREGADVEQRDFTGIDFTSWVYDLHRPQEPYAWRGTHPSGVGLDRYRLLDHLSEEERRHLRREARLTFLNFADPQMYGLPGLSRRGPDGSERASMSASLGHQLTPFGHTLDARLWARAGGLALLVVLHRFGNEAGAFPGLDLELAGRRARVVGGELELTPRISLWRQPRGQSYTSPDGKAGGLAGLRVRRSLGRRVSSWVEIEAKTAGWAAGSVSLERDVSLRLGLGLALTPAAAR
jgi:hypothetical protein